MSVDTYLLLSARSPVADVCVFPDGTAVVRWRGANPTTVVHASLDGVRAIHVDDHDGRSIEPSAPPEALVVRRAVGDAQQDDVENAPWASIGGNARKVLDPDWVPRAPGWIEAKYASVYLAAYLTRVRAAKYQWVQTMTVDDDS